MSGPVPDRPAGRLPTGLLGMLALALVVETTIAGLRDDLVRPLGESWRFAARAAAVEAPRHPVLCFGDSLVKYGLLPGVIEAEAGASCYNLATSGGTTASAYFLLRRAVESGASPRAIVVDFVALLPTADGPPRVLHYPELATVRDCLDLARTSGDPGFFGAALVAEGLPSARFRFEIRNALHAAFDGRSDSERDSVRSHRRIWARERGAQPTEPGRSRHPLESRLIDDLAPVAWSCPPTDEAYIDRFLDLAGSIGATTYWLLPPPSPEVGERRRARGSDAAYGRFVRSVAARHPAAVVLDARGSAADAPVHVDHLHLDRRGASALSAEVASVLAARAAGRGLAWVELPPLSRRLADEAPPAVARSRPDVGRESLGVIR